MIPNLPLSWYFLPLSMAVLLRHEKVAAFSAVSAPDDRFPGAAAFSERGFADHQQWGNHYCERRCGDEKRNGGE